MTHEEYKAILREVIRPTITKSGRHRIYGGLEMKNERNVVSGRTFDEALEKLTRIEFPMYIARMVRSNLEYEKVTITPDPERGTFIISTPIKQKSEPCKPIQYKKPAIIGGLTLDERVSPTCIHKRIPNAY